MRAMGNTMRFVGRNLLLMATLLSLFMRALGDGTWKHFLPKQVFLLCLVPMIVGASMGVFHVEEIPKQFYDLTLIEFTGPGGSLEALHEHLDLGVALHREARGHDTPVELSRRCVKQELAAHFLQ